MQHSVVMQKTYVVMRTVGRRSVEVFLYIKPESYEENFKISKLEAGHDKRVVWLLDRRRRGRYA
jgi:hypothetical protein